MFLLAGIWVVIKIYCKDIEASQNVLSFLINMVVGKN